MMIIGPEYNSFKKYIICEKHINFTYEIISKDAPPKAVEFFKGFNAAWMSRYNTPYYIFENEPLPPGLKYPPRMKIGPDK